MRPFRKSVPALVALSACAVLAPAVAAALRPAAPSAAAASHAVALDARLPASGVYDVRVTVTTPAAAATLVQVRIAGISRRAITQTPTHRAVITARVAVHGHHLRVRASAANEAPTLAVSWRHVGPLSTAPTASGALVPDGPGGNWHIVLDDEFAGTTLAGTHLRPGWPPSKGITPDIEFSGSKVCLDPSHDVVANGELDITITATPTICGTPYLGYATEPLDTGLVSTNGQFTYTYGFAEARIWVPAAADGTIADWPAFWAPTAPGHRTARTTSSRASAAWPASTTTGAPDRPPAERRRMRARALDRRLAHLRLRLGARLGHATTTTASGSARSPQASRAPRSSWFSGSEPDGASGASSVTPAAERVDYVRVWQH